jgi:hypothetical protein
MVGATGCTSSSKDKGSTTTPPATVSSSSGNPSSTKSATPTGSPTFDPTVKPAVDAYLAYWAAANEADRHPPSVDQTWPKGGDFTKFSFDPAQVETANSVYKLNQAGLEFRGTAPTARVAVTSVQLGAKPWPTVVLTNCPTPEPTWKAYDVRTGKAATAKPGMVPPPYLVTVKMIFYQKRWGAYQMTPDTSKTCSV